MVATLLVRATFPIVDATEDVLHHGPHRCVFLLPGDIQVSFSFIIPRIVFRAQQSIYEGQVVAAICEHACRTQSSDPVSQTGLISEAIHESCDVEAAKVVVVTLVHVHVENGA